ncbi:hypothetical protein J6590_037205 [Homalodisca vitripennis]|nr:hypothetical protein J6590_037205 [Homalodisca vitripennis]
MFENDVILLVTVNRAFNEAPRPLLPLPPPLQLFYSLHADRSPVRDTRSSAVGQQRPERLIV